MHTQTHSHAHTVNGLDDINYRRKWHNWILPTICLSSVCVCVRACGHVWQCNEWLHVTPPKNTRSPSVRGCEASVHWGVCLHECVHVRVCVLYKGRHGCHPPAPSCADTQVLIFAHLSPHQLLRPFPEGSPGRPQKSKQRQELIFIHRRDGNNKENLQFCQCYSRINRKHSRYLCDLLIRFKLDTISLKLASGL